MNQAANFISILFQPLLMPTFLFGILAWQAPERLQPLHADVFMPFIMLIFLITCALPVVFLMSLRLFGIIPNLMLKERKDRILPFFIIACMYGVLYWIFTTRFNLSLNEDLLKFLLICNVLVLISGVITLWFKISIHSLSVCGLLAIFVWIGRMENGSAILTTILTTVLVAGLVMSSRLQLQAHTPREVYVGAGVGYIASSLAMQFLF